MAVTTNNKVQLTLIYGDYSTHNYAFDGVPDSEIAGLKTRIQTANQNWTENSDMARTFVKESDTDPLGIMSTGIYAAQVTSTEEEVIYGG